MNTITGGVRPRGPRQDGDPRRRLLRAAGHPDGRVQVDPGRGPGPPGGAAVGVSRAGRARGAASRGVGQDPPLVGGLEEGNTVMRYNSAVCTAVVW